MSLIKDLLKVKNYAKPFSIISDSFPYKTSVESCGWFLLGELPVQHLKNYSEMIVESSQDDIEIFREGKGRKIFRAPFGDSSAIFKSFKFDSLSKKAFKYRFAAWDEAAGLLLAKKRNLPVPDLLGYLINKNSFLANFDCAIIENIENSIHPVEVFKKESDALPLGDILERCRELMLKIYEGACNHIDLHGTSFMLNLEDSKNDKIIDFQFAVFNEQPSINIFCHQVAHFVRASVKYLPEELLDEWAYTTLKEVSKNDLDHNLAIYEAGKVKKAPSSFQRMSLKA